jgi:hypothetical protein
MLGESSGRFLAIVSSPSVPWPMGDKPARSVPGACGTAEGGGRRAVPRRLRPNEPEGSAAIDCLVHRAGLAGRYMAIGHQPARCVPDSGSGPVGQGGRSACDFARAGRTNPRGGRATRARDLCGRYRPRRQDGGNQWRSDAIASILGHRWRAGRSPLSCRPEVALPGVSEPSKGDGQ